MVLLIQYGLDGLYLFSETVDVFVDLYTCLLTNVILLCKISARKYQGSTVLTILVAYSVYISVRRKSP